MIRNAEQEMDRNERMPQGGGGVVAATGSGRGLELRRRTLRVPLARALLLDFVFFPRVPSRPTRRHAVQLQAPHSDSSPPGKSAMMQGLKQMNTLYFLLARGGCQCCVLNNSYAQCFRNAQS